jgi:hypothetical protein
MRLSNRSITDFFSSKGIAMVPRTAPDSIHKQGTSGSVRLRGIYSDKVPHEYPVCILSHKHAF